jgi:hypothetical protein
VAEPGLIVRAPRSQSIREQTRPLRYGFLDLCEHTGKELMGGDAKYHLACERSFQVRLPGQTLKARYFRTALVAQEKGHLVLSEPTSLPVGPEIAHDPGRHMSAGRPGEPNRAPQLRERVSPQKKAKLAKLATLDLSYQINVIPNEHFMKLVSYLSVG